MFDLSEQEVSHQSLHLPAAVLRAVGLDGHGLVPLAGPHGLLHVPGEQGEQAQDTALYHAVVLQQMLKYLGPDIEKWWRYNDVRQ